jgi:hypothetical protein
MSATITISKKEYRELLKDSEWRLRLEGGGVDNWEWYGEALYMEKIIMSNPLMNIVMILMNNIRIKL